MKDTLISFLKDERDYLVTSFTVQDVLDKIPFFKHIIDTKQSTVLSPNNNWFWSPANKNYRDNLILDLGFVDKFDKTRTAYNLVLENFSMGKYGVMFPVDRLWTYDVPLSDVQLAEMMLNLENNPERECYNDKQYHYKLVWCLNHNIPFSDFEAWVILENILGFPLNFAQSQIAYNLLYGDLNELKTVYMTKEYTDIKVAMHAAILVHNGTLQTTVDNLIKDYIDAYAACNWNVCNNIEYQLSSLCEAPEGISERERSLYTQLEERCEKVFKEYPALPF